ncbi:hypothetical protein POJ06DRAFT_185320, partial [Lipomyces tetrasporus]
MEASLNIARLALGNRGPYMASVVRAWGKLFEETGSLGSPDGRGQHKKLRTALDDEDIKRKCIEYFRNTPTNQRTATALKAFYENTVYPEYSGRFERINISLTTVTGYLRKWVF